MSKYKNALIAFLDMEVKEEYSINYKINDQKSAYEFEVVFEDKTLNEIEVIVVHVDDTEPAYSEFKIHVHEDHYEDFCIYRNTLSEFWKRLLWQDSGALK